MTSSFYAVLFVATFPALWVLAAVLDRILPDRAPLARSVPDTKNSNTERMQCSLTSKDWPCTATVSASTRVSRA